MGKAPADQFYFGDFQRDMHGVRLEAVGGWSLLLCKMHFAKNRGEVTMRLEDYARFWGVSSDEAASILDHMEQMDVCDRFRSVDGLITVINRRMKRQTEERAADAERKRAERDAERREREERGDSVRPRGRPKKDVQNMSGECPSPLLSSSSLSTSDFKRLILRVCEDFPQADERVVELGMLYTMLQRNGSTEPIRSAKYFHPEIKKMLNETKGLDTKTIDVMLARRREQAGLGREL